MYYRLSGDAAGLLAERVQQFACGRLAEAERAARGYLGDVTALAPVSQRELYDRIRAGDVLVLDVRPGAEYAAAHIAGAVGIPHDELPGRLGELAGGLPEWRRAGPPVSTGAAGLPGGRRCRRGSCGPVRR